MVRCRQQGAWEVEPWEVGAWGCRSYGVKVLSKEVMGLHLHIAQGRADNAKAQGEKLDNDTRGT